MTQAQIQLLIDQIVPNVNYRANQLNPLLTDMLTASYGPMYIDNTPPTSGNDETEGYRTGSVAYDTISQRFYICKDATAGAADWVLIPSDANYEYKLYASVGDGMSLLQNTSVFKADNNSLAVNLDCYVDLPPNPYRGKVVVLYFQDAINQFDIRDSSGVPISLGASLTIPGGQQYTIAYNGSIWEIVGVSNINPATLSNLTVSKVGGASIPNSTSINFIGTAVTVAASGGGANVTINPLSGVDITRGSTTISAAQSITLTNNFALSGGAGVADIAYVSKIQIEQGGNPLTTSINSIDGFNFIGAMLSGTSTAISGTKANITLNGAKTLTLGLSFQPGVNFDESQGYSRGSVALNTGLLKRTYICTDNTTGAANWVRLTEDNGYISITPTEGGIATPNPDIANILFTNVGSTINKYSVNVPANAYVGKKLYMTFQSSIGELGVRDNSGSTTFGSKFSVTATPGAPKLIIFVCANEGTQTWVRMQ